MKITLDLTKSVEENAEVYFEKAKKAKRKVKGAKEALVKLRKRLEAHKKKQAKEEVVEEKIELPQEWYHKFRWFFTSDGFLVIGGRDATSNEIVVKKRLDKGDLVFHTDMAGSPFFVIKAEGKKVSEKAILEVADTTCSYSRAWKLGLATTSVFYVNPDQLSKTPKSGEYLTKGSFIISGKTNYVDNEINCALGMREDGHVMGGPLDAVKENCKEFVVVIPGKEKTSKVAKDIKKKIGGDLDEIIRTLPAGGAKIKK